MTDTEEGMDWQRFSGEAGALVEQSSVRPASVHPVPIPRHRHGGSQRRKRRKLPTEERCRAGGRGHSRLDQTVFGSVQQLKDKF